MKISALKSGQTLYSVERQYMGNTLVKTTRVFGVTVTGVSEDGRSFTASWNGNAPHEYRKVPSTWKTRKPILVNDGWSYRLAHRGEEGERTEGPLYFTIVKARR